MASAMSWKEMSRGSGSPKASEISSSLTSQVQLYCSVHQPVRTRCLELEGLIRRSSSKDLHGVYPLLLDTIFGLNGQPGWSLHTLTSQYAREDFKHLLDFMSPTGPLFLMVYKLHSDQYLRYEFPVSKLPSPTLESLAAGIVPPFYHGKITYQSHGRAPSVVMLNAFEYYMFIFAYFLVSDRVHQAMNCWVQPQDCIYPVLLDQYLSFFLRSDGRAVPPIPVTNSAPSPTANHLSPYRLPQYGVLYHYLHSYPVSGPEHRHHTPKQFHDSSLSLQPQHLYHHHQHHHQGLSPGPGAGGTSGSSTHGISFQQSLHEDPRGETWRSEVLIQALTEFWLNQNSLRYSGEKGFMSQVKENFVPSQDHIRLVRILVKRLHFFVNSAQPSVHQSAYQQRGNSAMEQLKRLVLPAFIQQSLYIFLRHGFDQWPLDSSFRQILELWLSYIQPWRYVDETHRTGFLPRDAGHLPLGQQRPLAGGSKTFPGNEEKWRAFVRENLPFYTVLFQELLPRIFHQDLSIPNNALMVYRVAKVFGQTHLGAVMKEGEDYLLGVLQTPSQPYSSLTSPNPSFTSLSSTVSSSSSPPNLHNTMGSRIYTHLFEVETSGFVYRPLFGVDGRLMIEQLLGLVSQAQVTAKTMAGPSISDFTQTIKSFFNRSIRHANHSVLFDDIGLADARKAEGYLQSAGDFLSEVFDVPVPCPDDTTNWNVGQIGRDLHLPPDTMDGQLTHRGKYQLMNRLRSSDVSYHGDPDLQPIRTFENAVLVRALHSLSCQFNEAFGNRILEACIQGGLFGAMVRWYFGQRKVLAVAAADHTGSIPSWVRPRLSLRFLASYRNLAYLGALYLALVYLWDASLAGFVAFLLATLLFVGFVGAAYDYLLRETNESEMHWYRDILQVEQRHQHVD